MRMSRRSQRLPCRRNFRLRLGLCRQFETLATLTAFATLHALTVHALAVHAFAMNDLAARADLYAFASSLAA